MMDIPALGLLGEPLYISPSTPFDITPDVQLVCKYLKAYDDIVDRHGSRRIDKLYPMGEFYYMIQVNSLIFLCGVFHRSRSFPYFKYLESSSSCSSEHYCEWTTNKVQHRPSAEWWCLQPNPCTTHGQKYYQEQTHAITFCKVNSSLLLQLNYIWLICECRAKPIESVSTSIPRYVRVLSQHRYMHRRCAFLDTLPGFNYNNGVGEYTDINGQCKKTDTRNLGSTMMKAMLSEVKEFCDPSVKQNWALKPHQQVQ